MSPSPPSRTHRRLGALLLALGAAWAYAGVLAVRTRLSANAIDSIEAPSTQVEVAGRLFPQGWRFFTRNPQESVITPYEAAPGGWASASIMPNSRASNLFGLDRRGRTQIPEVVGILSQMKSHAWVDCTGAPLGCLDGAPLAGTVVNKAPAPSLCGEVAFVSQPPVPWAWARSGREVVMPSRVTRVRIRC
ncbi:MAG TPA: SdpA family antimicrobial peptide system protein [Polyangiaceae bacterium]|jgi:antimicrobial peptide system SdpA family protein